MVALDAAWVLRCHPSPEIQCLFDIAIRKRQHIEQPYIVSFRLEFLRGLRPVAW